MNSAHPAFVDLVRRQLKRDYRDEDLRGAGLRIFTTLSPVAQDNAERALSGVLAKLGKRKKSRKLQGAMVVTAVDSAEVLAVVGSRQVRQVGFNRALDAVRPIGSLVKPAVYLAALEDDLDFCNFTGVPTVRVLEVLKELTDCRFLYGRYLRSHTFWMM